MFKHLRTIPLFTLAVLLPLCAFTQGLSLDNGIKRSQINFTRDNYVSPEEYEQSLGQQPEQEDNSSTDTDQEGPWMICKIEAEGLVNIR